MVDIVGGEDWNRSIRQAIRSSDFILVCMSARSVNKRGYFQREIKMALDLWEEKLEDDIYLIPVRLEDCQCPEQITRFQWVDWFEPSGWQRLREALHAGLERQGKTLSQVLVPDKFPEVSDLWGHEMVYVPPGPFLMGSDPAVDDHALATEDPQHTVDLAGYWIGRYTVTVGQYRVFVQESRSKPTDEDFPQGPDDHPVVLVNWRQALGYCRWLGKRVGDVLPEGYVVSLPSEAEWEKAARGTNGRVYPWGNDPAHDRLCNSNSSVGTTTPVGYYSPQGDSPYGCADMAGNVWEWTRSLMLDYPYDSSDGREYLETDGPRVVRGGSCFNSERFVRCAFRGWLGPYIINLSRGFRVVVAPNF